MLQSSIEEVSSIGELTDAVWFDAGSKINRPLEKSETSLMSKNDLHLFDRNLQTTKIQNRKCPIGSKKPSEIQSFAFHFVE
jgi:hypothetical protein